MEEISHGQNQGSTQGQACEHKMAENAVPRKLFFELHSWK
jgi:hypothetical protein